MRQVLEVRIAGRAVGEQDMVIGLHRQPGREGLDGLLVLLLPKINITLINAS